MLLNFLLSSYGHHGRNSNNCLLSVFNNLCEPTQRSPSMERLAYQPIHELMPIIMVTLIFTSMHVTFEGIYLPAVHSSWSSWTGLTGETSFWLAIFSYVQCVATDPGGIPDNWGGGPGCLPQFLFDHTVRLMERKKTSGELRYCNKEQKFKPDRAHFCSHMKRNILKMDHYCPWMDNCVGFGNYKYYVLFLIYASFNANFTFANLLHALLCPNYHFEQTVMMCIGLFLSLSVSLPLTPLLSFHIMLLTKNLTTIEFCDMCRQAGGGSMSVLLEAKSKYDLGVLSNIKSVAGEHCCYWLLPIGRPSGNGLEWSLKDEELRQHLQHPHMVDANHGFNDTSARTAKEQRKSPEHTPKIIVQEPAGSSSSSSSNSRSSKTSSRGACICAPFELETLMTGAVDRCTTIYAGMTEALCQDWAFPNLLSDGGTHVARGIKTTVSVRRAATGASSFL